MTLHLSLIAAMRKVLAAEKLNEVAASGEIVLPVSPQTLFPGAVYGFAARLSKEDLHTSFQEATKRGLARPSMLESIKPIEDELYPLYWGKDKQIGARPYQHLNNPVGTGAIRLSTYQSLLGKPIACATLVVSDHVAAERAIQKAFPDILKTSTKKHDA